MRDNLVITMSDEGYFCNGDLFLKTRNRINADFVLYTPIGPKGLSRKNLALCTQNNIEVKRVSESYWESFCQSLKFVYIENELINYEFITFCDFDTYFIQDWHYNVFDLTDFSIAVTSTVGYPQYKYSRSKTNGGVIFVKNNINTIILIRSILQCISSDGKEYSEAFKPIALSYNKIWEELEDPKRREDKRHFRTNHSWWCDQIMLSALYYNGAVSFECRKYNQLDADRNINDKSDVYIKHLKAKNRKTAGLISG